ncbi:MAG: histidinol-phosphate transaminase [Pseudomonadales bacterium]|nr:histidinol-phosphate transaminase [Pseudomonadales bacterium]
MVVEGVRQLQPYQGGKPIEELERELGIRNIVKLASNENPLGASPRALEAINQQMKNIARYPDGSGFSLKSAIAGHLSVKADQVSLGNGSNEILELLARLFLQPGLNAVMSQHAFIVYPLAVTALNAEVRQTPAINFGHDLDAMLAAIDSKTRMVFIANPNNPTGTWLNHQAINAFMDRVPENVIVVIDEAYFEYVSETGFASALSLLDSYPNLVVTRTFSKAYGLAGLRVGYSVSSREIAELLNRIREPFNINSLALCAAEAALSDISFLEKSRQLNDAGMRQLERGAAERGLDFIPSIGNFICIRFPGDVNDLYRQLLCKGVIVRPIGVYGLNEHLRVSVGLEEENSKFLSAVSELMA